MLFFTAFFMETHDEKTSEFIEYFFYTVVFFLLFIQFFQRFRYDS